MKRLMLLSSISVRVTPPNAAERPFRQPAMTVCAGNSQVCMNHVCERHQLFAISIAGDDFAPRPDAVVLKKDGDVARLLRMLSSRLVPIVSITPSIALARKGNASAIPPRSRGLSRQPARFLP
ncbi:hypothetical protein NKI54_33775 [Mesorhizobium sp. M0663]|uniref:hypothetical protein n=1 Tax=unclassified Mesorhizobium TaxID=325217 RepID=UPI003339AAA2